MLNIFTNFGIFGYYVDNITCTIDGLKIAAKGVVYYAWINKAVNDFYEQKIFW